MNSTLFKIIITAAIVGLVLICIMAKRAKGETMDSNDFHGLDNEIPVIKAVAERNKCIGKLYSILLAIRKAEGVSTFGIKHPACDDMVQKDPNNAADIYASFAARTVRNNYQRWKDTGNVEGGIPAFVNFLADRYCPASIDPEGNKNWRKNVLFWFKKIEVGK